jgi:hypothetical protein
MSNIIKIAKCWDVTNEAAKDIIERMQMSDGEHATLLSNYGYAGVIDDDTTQDKLWGHTGYWLARKNDEVGGGGYVRFITNSDPMESVFCKKIADTIGIKWTNFNKAFADYALDNIKTTTKERGNISPSVKSAAAHENRKNTRRRRSMDQGIGM